MDRPADLETLFSPVSAGDFFSTYWQRRPLFSGVERPDRFAGVAGLADVDEMVASITALDAGWLLLNKDGVERPNSTVRGKDPYPDMAKVYAAYDEGYTLILSALQQRWPSIRSLCRDFERELLGHGVALSRRVGANLYLTPPGARGFDPHYDDHDVFILQIEGEKHWRLYGQHRPRPIRQQAGHATRLPPLETTETIHPGQALYIPRGVYHAAETSRGHSLHLTISMVPITWMALVSRMLVAVEPSREALPLMPPQGGFEEALRGQFEELVRVLRDSGDPVSWARRLGDETMQELGPLPDDGFGQRHRLERLTLQSRVRHRHGALVDLRTEQGQGRLLFPGSGFRGPEEMMPLFRHVIAHESFRIAELPDAVTNESKLEIARQLIREGLLCVDDRDEKDEEDQ